jgi:hypothetical protein
MGARRQPRHAGADVCEVPSEVADIEDNPAGRVHILILQGELEVAFCGEAEGAEATLVES